MQSNDRPAHVIPFVIQGHVCMTFELLGESLADIVAGVVANPVTLDQVRDITAQLLQVLQFDLCVLRGWCCLDQCKYTCCLLSHVIESKQAVCPYKYPSQHAQRKLRFRVSKLL